MAYGNMAVKASKLVSETRQRLNKTVAEPSEQDLLEEEMAVAAMGAKHTEHQLLRASRLCLVTSRAHQDCCCFVFLTEMILLEACRTNFQVSGRPWAIHKHVAAS